MSKRKRRQQRKEPQTDSGPQPVDRRALEKPLADLGKLLREKEFDSVDEINAFLEDMLASGEPLAVASRTPLDQAQDIMYQAWDATGAQRVRLAKKALSISEDCADAYVLLAEETARTIQEARRLFEQGVKAGERALGPKVFEEDVGHFWGILETRPYMRARLGLAECLLLMGERQEAIEHLTDMLRLNPNDNQGIRYLLATLLLEAGDDEALGTLLEQYAEDATAAWRYTRALLLFRKEGTSEAATAQLREAISFNPFVSAYLLDRKRLPKRLPPYMGFGDENEAIHYAVDGKDVWRQNEGALGWLRKTLTDMGYGPGAKLKK